MYGKYERRKGALERLEKQLNSGKKYKKVDKRQTNILIDLSDSDRKRIDKEIKILNERLG